jgi:hypothetical protein
VKTEGRATFASLLDSPPEDGSPDAQLLYSPALQAVRDAFRRAGVAVRNCDGAGAVLLRALWRDLEEAPLYVWEWTGQVPLEPSVAVSRSGKRRKKLDKKYARELERLKSGGPVVALPSILAELNLKEADWLPVATRFCVDKGLLDQIQAAALACLPSPLSDESERNDDEGDGSGALQGVPRRLLDYMKDRKKTEIDDEMCRAIWYKPCHDVSEDAIKSALRKVNQFLSSRSQETLSRSGIQIHWA